MSAPDEATRDGDSGGPVLVSRAEPNRSYDVAGMVVAGKPATSSVGRLVPTVITPLNSILIQAGLEVVSSVGA